MCRLCGETFDSRQELGAHMRWDHGKSATTDDGDGADLDEIAESVGEVVDEQCDPIGRGIDR